MNFKITILMSLKDLNASSRNIATKKSIKQAYLITTIMNYVDSCIYARGRLHTHC